MALSETRITEAKLLLFLRPPSQDLTKTEIEVSLRDHRRVLLQLPFYKKGTSSGVRGRVRGQVGTRPYNPQKPENSAGCPRNFPRKSLSLHNTDHNLENRSNQKQRAWTQSKKGEVKNRSQ